MSHINCCCTMSFLFFDRKCCVSVVIVSGLNWQLRFKCVVNMTRVAFAFVRNSVFRKFKKFQWTKFWIAFCSFSIQLELKLQNNQQQKLIHPHIDLLQLRGEFQFVTICNILRACQSVALHCIAFRSIWILSVVCACAKPNCGNGQWLTPVLQIEHLSKSIPFEALRLYTFESVGFCCWKHLKCTDLTCRFQFGWSTTLS